MGVHAQVSYPEGYDSSFRERVRPAFKFGEHVDFQYVLGDWEAAPRRAIVSFFVWLADGTAARAPLMVPLAMGAHCFKPSVRHTGFVDQCYPLRTKGRGNSAIPVLNFVVPPVQVRPGSHRVVAARNAALGGRWRVAKVVVRRSPVHLIRHSISTNCGVVCDADNLQRDTPEPGGAPARPA